MQLNKSLSLLSYYILSIVMSSVNVLLTKL